MLYQKGSTVCDLPSINEICKRRLNTRNCACQLLSNQVYVHAHVVVVVVVVVVCLNFAVKDLNFNQRKLKKTEHLNETRSLTGSNGAFNEYIFPRYFYVKRG